MTGESGWGKCGKAAAGVYERPARCYDRKMKGKDLCDTTERLKKGALKNERKN